jgi:hypothetical protein
MFKGPVSATVCTCLLCVLTCESSRAQAPIRLGSEFAVNTYITGEQYDSAVAMSANGDFVVAWTSFGPDGSSYGVFARRFTSAGAPQGGEFQVNSYTVGAQTAAAVDRASTGAFVVVWTSFA